MIPFSCPACQKKLAVKEELAGKEVRCPGCGQTVTITARAALTPSAEAAAAPRPSAGGRDGQEQRTQASPPAGSDVRTHQSSSDPDATLGAGKPDAADDPRL